MAKTPENPIVNQLDAVINLYDADVAALKAAFADGTLTAESFVNLDNLSGNFHGVLVALKG